MLCDRIVDSCQGLLSVLVLALGVGIGVACLCSLCVMALVLCVGVGVARQRRTPQTIAARWRTGPRAALSQRGFRKGSPKAKARGEPTFRRASSQATVRQPMTSSGPAHRTSSPGSPP